jgi:hypothetical protein
MTIAAEYPVEGAVPAAPSYGLVATATIVDEPQERWLNGVTVWPFPDAMPGTFDQCAGGSGGRGGSAAVEKDDGGVLPPPVTFGSYTVYLGVTCSAIGWDDANYRARALAALAASESFAIEDELYHATRVPANLSLAGAGVATILNGGVQTNALNGLALLEEAAGDTGRAQQIHAGVGVATAWMAQQLLVERAGKLYTAAGGTQIVVGRGYDGSAPAGGPAAAAGTQRYTFVTGPVHVRRSEMFLVPDTLGEALDQQTNTVTLRAERYYNVSWDGVFCAALRIDRCLQTCAPEDEEG